MRATLAAPIDHAPTPVDGFSQCHAGILAGLREFGALPALSASARRARTLARQTLELLDEAVLQHHAEEEGELFPAVLRSARPGAERERVRRLVDVLVEGHREIEALWKRLRPQVLQVVAGRDDGLQADRVELLLACYQAHATLEERELLPLAQEILGRDGNHMAALGLALHLRHVPTPIGYI